MRRTVRQLRVLATILVLVSIAGVACKYRVAPTAGISVTAHFRTSSSGEQALELARVAQTGARWIRLNLEWDLVQRSGPTEWNFAEFDVQARLAEEQGLEVLAVAIWTPGWANGGQASNVPPDNPVDFARFVETAVRRYTKGGPAGRHIRAWEIWNEPNHPPFWAGAPDAQRYVDLLRHAYYGVKRADPNAIVVSGGLAPNGDLNQDPTNAAHPINYLNAMYFYGAQGAFDAFGHHPYASVPYGPLADDRGAMGWNSFVYTETLYGIMAANGDGYKQIWGTETGPPTGPCGRCVSEATQAKWLAEETLIWRSWPFTGPLFWHAGRDAATGSNVPDENYGLLRSDFSPKPAFAVATDLW